MPMLKDEAPPGPFARLALRLGCKDGTNTFAAAMRGDHGLGAAMFVVPELVARAQAESAS